jgi:arginine exporter protein ArgO
MKDKKFIDGFLLGFTIASILWWTLLGYILGQLN